MRYRTLHFETIQISYNSIRRNNRAMEANEQLIDQSSRCDFDRIDSKWIPSIETTWEEK